MKRPGHARARESGTAVLEFALTFMLLWVLMGGAFRFGYAMYVYESLVSGVAGAARYAARVDFDSPNHAFVASVQNMAVYGSPAVGTDAIAPGLQPANIQVTWTTDAAGVPQTITVTVVNYTIDAVFQSFTWNGKPSVTVRYAGMYKT